MDYMVQADRRPDFFAPRLGYDAQDQQVRTAILSQFPNLTVGIVGGSDNSNVRNIGPQIQLELPIFDHAQGLIAQENATRQQLHDVARGDLAGVERTAQSALQAGNLDERSALDLIAARATKQLEIIALEQALLDQQVAIDTLTGAGMPSVAP